MDWNMLMLNITLTAAPVFVWGGMIFIGLKLWRDIKEEEQPNDQ